MKRYAQVIGLKPEHREEYSRYHAAVWPEVLATIERCNIRNYSIYRYNDLLFAYFEYHGTDFDADMRRMAKDPHTQRWWSIMDPMQTVLTEAEGGPRWFQIPEEFHFEGSPVKPA